MDRRILLLGFLTVTGWLLVASAVAVFAGGGMSDARLSKMVPPMNWMHLDAQGLQSEAEVRKKLREYEFQLQREPENHAVLVRTAYLYYRLGWLFLHKQKEKDSYFQFFDYAKRACELEPLDYQSLLLLSVAKAKIVEYLSHGDQVRIARELARDAEKLVEMRWDDPDAVYLLSWLNFEIGQVSSLRRMLATALFGGLPQGLSVEKAFDLMHKAIQVRPDYVVYQYDLGFYYLRTGEKEKARQQFLQVLAGRSDTVEEIVYQRRAEGKMRELTGEVN